MILGGNNRTLEKSGEFKSQTFGIKNAGKLFKILVDGIYSDGPGSIVREITSNALDANKESKTDKKVKITYIEQNNLMNVSEQLVIRDFGIGLSPDRMWDVFCNLGESTKDNSNEEIGGYGIGSKSPFKYTDSFSIKTIHKGKEYLYITNLNEDGVAEMNEIYSQDSDEESGTEVIIPIQYKDRGAFQRAIHSQLMYLDDFIEVSKNINYQKQQIEYRSNKFLYNPSEANYAITLGSIRYELPYEIRNKVSNIAPQGVVCTFNIGELTPTASRESLQIDSNTENFIVERFKEAGLELTKMVKDNLDTAPNFAEWCKAFYMAPASLTKNITFYKNYNIGRLCMWLAKKAYRKNQKWSKGKYVDYNYYDDHSINQTTLIQNFAKPEKQHGTYFYDKDPAISLRVGNEQGILKTNEFCWYAKYTIKDNTKEGGKVKVKTREDYGSSLISEEFDTLQQAEDFIKKELELFQEIKTLLIDLSTLKIDETVPIDVKSTVPKYTPKSGTLKYRILKVKDGWREEIISSWEERNLKTEPILPTDNIYVYAYTDNTENIKDAYTKYGKYTKDKYIIVGKETQKYLPTNAIFIDDLISGKVTTKETSEALTLYGLYLEDKVINGRLLDLALHLPDEIGEDCRKIKKLYDKFEDFYYRKNQQSTDFHALLKEKKLLDNDILDTVERLRKLEQNCILLRHLKVEKDNDEVKKHIVDYIASRKLVI